MGHKGLGWGCRRAVGGAVGGAVDNEDRLGLDWVFYSLRRPGAKMLLGRTRSADKSADKKRRASPRREERDGRENQEPRWETMVVVVFIAVTPCPPILDCALCFNRPLTGL